MKIKRKIYILIFLICICILLLISINIKDNNKNNSKNLKTSTVENDSSKNYKNLMIVAHPDDETIWGGANLLEDDYVVVCVTCGVSNVRSEEFKKVMEITNDEYIMLGYPDKIDNTISNWEYIYDSIENNLSNIIKSKNFEKIITHNPEGEYGHIHHKMISNMVTKHVDKSKLYYFGKFYSSDDEVLKNMNKIDENLYQKKFDILYNVYESQSQIMFKYIHMFPYENWIQYYNWIDASI